MAMLSLLSVAAAARAQGEADVFPTVGHLLQSRCAMPACHGGPAAAQGMRLEADRVYRSVVNVPARTDSRFLRVAPGDPDHSLLYLKLLSPHQGGYRGPRMPLSMDPLKDEEIAQIRAWIDSFPPDLWGRPVEAEGERPSPRTFQDAVLANLPTSDPIGARTLEFLFVHRFKAAATDAGSKGLYGLDSGAWISLSLAYGLTDTLDIGLRRTNLETDYEGYAKWAFLQQESGRSPVSISFRGSVSNVRETDRVNRTRWGSQLILARRFGDRLSLMAVPTYVTRTNGLNAKDDRGTGALGVGAQMRLGSRYALTGEWIVQTSGVQAPFQSASLGFSVATAHHVFQLLVTNTQGHHTDLYVPGGDLDARDGEFRLGFNISRTHAFRAAERSPPP
jgi:Membrane bound beta barrel domain (DUF5777)